MGQVATTPLESFFNAISSPAITPSTAGSRVRRLRAKRPLLRPTTIKLATQGISVRQGLTNLVKVLLRHSSVPITVNTTTAGVVRKAHQCAVLVRVEVLGVVEFANAVLETLDVVCE